MDVVNFKKAKQYTIQVFVFLIGIVIVDQTYFFFRPDKALSGHYNPSDINRIAKPYIGFAGAPNVLDHNQHGYRGDLIEENFNGIKIAFFGGSTGYQGNPPIPKMIESVLEKKLDTPINVANFSVPSANHNQHLHNIIETNRLYKPDFVIFYGGYNEIVQPLQYDPRPGYPYNWFYRNDTSLMNRLLLENSPAAFALYRIAQKNNAHLFTPIEKIRSEVKFLSPEWKFQLIENYFSTIALAKKISSTITSQKCRSPNKFIFFYQPYIVPEELKMYTQKSGEKLARYHMVTILAIAS